jgi:hypothetical protein
VIDSFLYAHATISFSDAAGNRTRLDLTYEQPPGSFELVIHPIPTTEVGRRCPIDALAIRNTSTNSIRIDDITSDDFALAVDTSKLRFPLIIAPGSTTNIPFIFLPDVAMTFHFNLRVYSNVGVKDTATDAVGTELGVVTASERPEQPLSIAISQNRDLVATLVNRTEGTFRIEIFNILGKRVLALDEYATAGIARIGIPAAPLPKGVYFCRTISPGRTVRSTRFEIP